MTYQQALDWLYSTQNFGIKLGLDAPKKLLRQFFANPKNTTKVVHAAGTNGKGSTCAMIDALSRSSGMRSGLFTSPHLVEFRERIRVNGEMISERAVAQYLTELRDMVSDWKHHPTFFEITLVIAMRYFKQQDCEIIVLETGMGGRLDATTAVPADVCVITPIALDHSEWLGDTLEKVAGEKAGIIVDPIPVISAEQQAEAALVIATKADEQGATLTTVSGPLLGYSINLIGQHQACNAKLAVEAATALEIPLNFDIVQHALSKLSWPGRFETVNDSPHTIIDGAHNPHAAIALVDTWKQQFGDQKASLIFGAVEEKEVTQVLETLSQIAAEIHLTPLDSPRSLATETIIKSLDQNSLSHRTHENLEAALSFLSNSKQPILIAGSLFLIGEAKALLSGSNFQRSTQ